MVSHHIKTSEDFPKLNLQLRLRLKCIIVQYKYDCVHICLHFQKNTISAKFQVSSEHSTDCPVGTIAFQSSKIVERSQLLTQYFDATRLGIETNVHQNCSCLDACCLFACKTMATTLQLQQKCLAVQCDVAPKGGWRCNSCKIEVPSETTWRSCALSSSQHETTVHQ